MLVFISAEESSASILPGLDDREVPNPISLRFLGEWNTVKVPIHILLFVYWDTLVCGIHFCFYSEEHAGVVDNFELEGL